MSTAVREHTEPCPRGLIDATRRHRTPRPGPGHRPQAIVPGGQDTGQADRVGGRVSTTACMEAVSSYAPPPPPQCRGMSGNSVCGSALHLPSLPLPLLPPRPSSSSSSSSLPLGHTNALCGGHRSSMAIVAAEAPAAIGILITFDSSRAPHRHLHHHHHHRLVNYLPRLPLSAELVTFVGKR